MRIDLRWGIPVAVVALVAAFGLGIAVCRNSPKEQTEKPPEGNPARQEVMEKTKHPLAGKYITESPAWSRLWIITGGQSGVDRAAFDVALELDLPTRGWCPKNRLAEDGRIAERYPAQESASEDPALRTELNAFDSDGTLVISKGIPKDGTPLTEEVAKLYGKPLLYIDLDEELTDATVKKFRDWVTGNKIRILNIGGPRESHEPGMIYKRSRQIIERLLRK